MKVTSIKDLDFPQLDWGISAGEEKDLPADKSAQEIILAHELISKVGEVKVGATKSAGK